MRFLLTYLSRGLSLFGFTLLQANTTFAWLPYYGFDASLESFRPFEWVILQPDFHRWVHSLNDQGKTVFGYLSLGSYFQSDPEIPPDYFSSIHAGETPNWPEAMMVDVRSPLWIKWILEERIPRILHKGFHGIFLDTVDNAQHLETTNPERFSGMQQAMLNLIQAIRENYPEITIIMNRGLYLGERVAPFIDAILLENLFSHYNFDTKEYSFLPESSSQESIAAINRIYQANTAIKKLSLDFWYPEDGINREKLYKEAQLHGFLPYVGEIDLSVIILPPKNE